MALKLDSRQTRQRSKLDQLSTTTDLRLDAIMNLINDELTMPLRMRANLGSGVDGSPDQNLYIDSIFMKTADIGAADSGHERTRTIPPINGVLPNYYGSGSINFNETTGAITASNITLAGSYSLPAMTNGQFVKVLVWLSATTTSSYQFGLEIGTPAISEATANLPTPPSDVFALGYVVMTKGASTYSKVLNENIYQFVGGGGSGGGSGASKEITQANSFAVGDVVYYTGSTYAKAQADTAAKAETVGIVSKASAAKFTVTELGYITGLSSLTPGEVYYLSAATAGALTATEPSTIGQISKPMLIADSAISGYVLNYRGVVVGGTNARSEIDLVNNGTKNIQLVTGYPAAELKGWVYINASTPYRFHISIQFSQNGTGSDYNVSYQTSGDTPPAGFSVDYASNYVTMTLPLLAGFASAKLNYSLNGPAIGATFPLSVDAATITTGTVAAARLPEAGAAANGIVNTSAQTIAGDKTFSGLISANGGILSAGLTGANATTAVTGGSGKVGEIKNTASALTAGALTITTLTNIGNGTLSLEAGIWEITYDVNIALTNGATNTAPNFSEVNAWFQIAQAGAEVDNSLRSVGNREVGNSSVNCIMTCQLRASAFVNISSTTTYTLQGAYSIGGSGTGSASLNNSGTTKSRFYARRIA